MSLESGKVYNKRLSASRNQSSLRTANSLYKRGPVMPLNSGSASKNSPRPATTAANSQSQFVQESNIGVYVRCRSRSEREILENSGVVVSTLGHNGKEVIIQAHPASSTNKTYTFDRVFGAESDQETVFEGIATEVLGEMLQGYNCTIFAYGQTGTGKTYSMSGDISSTANGGLSTHAGIIPRVLVELFKRLHNPDSSDETPSVRVSFIELYNEELKDLLLPESSERKVRIYDDHEKKSIVVQGMQEVFIQNAQEGLKLLGEGSYKRQVAATQCNDLSSRSHTVFTVTVHMKKIDPISGEEYMKVGKLNLVDLAGSENITRSGAENKRAREAGMINQSLLTLGRVINCLVDKSAHIPYRESKLTRLLQDSLGGQTKTCILATISPAKVSLEETLSTLEYASRAKNIKNKPQVNQSMSKQMLISEYIQEIETLRKDLAATREQSGGVYMTTENHKKLVEESESRRILIDEQKLRIDLLEDQNKRFKSTYEQQAEECKMAKLETLALQRELETCRAQLVLMENRAIDFENKYQDELMVREELQKTDSESRKIYNALVKIADQINESKLQLQALIVEYNNLFELNCQSLELKKTRVADFVDNKLQTAVELLQNEHKLLLLLLSSNFSSIISDHYNKCQGKKLALEESKSEILAQTDSVTLELADSISDLIEMVTQTLDRTLQNQNSLFYEGMDQVKDNLSSSLKSQLSQISGVDSSVQDSYHSIGNSFKTSFELIETQMTLQIDELNRLNHAFQAHIVAGSGILQNQIRAFKAAHEAELGEQEKEQTRLIQSISKLIEQSNFARRDRLSLAFKQGQESLQTIDTENSKFLESHSDSVSNLVKAEELFVHAIADHKEGLRMKLVSSYEDNKKTISELGERARMRSSELSTEFSELQAKAKLLTSQVDLLRKDILSENENKTNEVWKKIGNLKKRTSDCLEDTCDSFMQIGQDLHQLKPNLIDSYVKEQQGLVDNHRTLISDKSREIGQTVSSIHLEKPQFELPPAVKYEYPPTLPQLSDREEILKNRKRKAYLVEEDDCHLANETGIIVNALEKLTPLPVPVPDLPMVENTPSSMMKAKKARPGPLRNLKIKPKALQELNM